MREMRISDLIKELKQLKKEHGNIKAGHNGGADDEGKKYGRVQVSKYFI